MEVTVTANRANQLEVITDVWERHEDRAYIEEMSHWRGAGRYADDDVWLAIGKAALDRFELFARMKNRPLPESPVMLEWGPGGGSNAFAFRDTASAYYGVDISQSNLDECTRQMAEGPCEFRSVLLDGEPETIEGLDPVDLFLSTSVFMHFPDKEYGARVLKVMRANCKHGAMGLIQIRFDNHNPKFSAITRLEDYADKHITATSYRLDEFTDLCLDAGFEVSAVIGLRTANNSAVFCLVAR